METLLAFYAALTVFGLGVTAAAVLGALEHTPEAGPGPDGDAGDAPPEPEGAGPAPEGADGARRGALAVSGGGPIVWVSRTLGVLRTAVYFALGAGPTGLAALAAQRGPRESLYWSLAAGAGIAVLGRLFRRLGREELDSSIKPEAFLLEKAVVLTPIAPGSIGKAAVRLFGREREIYVRCRDARLALLKGCAIRIVDYDDSLYWIEPLDGGGAAPVPKQAH
ncbi:MAG: hypothetical protein LBD37_07170 [Treponema sp.]|jgi:hypothetical protein|nr:hypothetical protein [Treponema sp.]